MVTIKEIARMAGVSTTTVSNVLHKKNARVSEQTIEKVEKLLAENNYIPRLGLSVFLLLHLSLQEDLHTKLRFMEICLETWKDC